jgi:hypothetical protein
MITHYGYNHTHTGHHMRPVTWIPVKVDLAFLERLHYLVRWEPRLCRIWVHHDDGRDVCIYWYEQGTLDLAALGVTPAFQLPGQGDGAHTL